MRNLAVVLAICLAAEGYAFGVGTFGAGTQGYGVNTAGTAAGYPGFANGFFPQFGGYAALFGRGLPVQKPPQVRLAGKRKFDTRNGDEFIGAIITEKAPAAGYGGLPLGGFPGLAGYGAGAGLQMVVEIFSSTIQPGQRVYIAITEFAGLGQEGICTPESVGPVIQHDAHGFSKVGGYPVNPAFALQGLIGAYPTGGPEPLPEGVIADVQIQPGQPSTININSLGSIATLDIIAGRGIIACTKIEKNYMGRYVCTGKVLSCAGLTYERVPEPDH